MKYFSQINLPPGYTMAFDPITINIPIEIDAGSFATSTTVQGETVTYSKVHLPLLYRTVTLDPTVQNMRDTFQFKEAEDQTLVTVDISGGAIGSFANGTAVVKSLFKAALDGSALTSIAMTSGTIYADGTTRNTNTDPLKFYANKDTHTVGTGAGSTLKAYLLEYLYDNLSNVIGLAATTGTLDITLSRDGNSASEIIAEALATQLCGSSSTEQGVAAAALRQNIYEQMFTLAPERFQESTLMRQDPAGNIAYQDLPFQENDTMAFLVTFKFPASQISAPVVSNAIRTSESSVFVDTGSKISVAAGTNATSSLQNLLSDFPDATVMMRVQLTDGKTAPAAPTGLTVTSGDGQVEIAFTAGSDNGSAITNYKYSIDGGVTYTALSPADSISPIVITGLTNGTEYQIKLRAVNSIGDGAESAAVTATTAAAPAAPTELSATPGDSQITVSFTAGADNGAAITNYKYSIDGGVSYVAFSPADVDSPVVITGLTNGTTYSVKLRAVNNAGDGAESAAVSATPVTVPSAPTGLVATRGDTQATITFTAGSNGGSAITNYKYSIDGGVTYTALSPADSVSPIIITGLTNGTEYQIKLRAVNSIGDGAESAAVTATTAAPPTAPTGLSATPGDSQITVSFTAGADNGAAITNYKYSIDGGMSYVAFSPVDVASPVVITGLTNGTSYSVKLRAVNNAGDGAESAAVSATPVTVPSAPTGLVATRGDTQATITFTAGSNGGSAITNYKYSIDNGVTYVAFSPVDTTSPVTITGLTNGTTYQIKLRAVNAVGDGAQSAAVSVIPSGPTWTQKGLDIDGENTDDQSGYSVSLSSDGSIIAIGANNNDGNGSNSGHVRVYAWNGTAWIQRGDDINGESANSWDGRSVSLSSNGLVLAIGGPGNNNYSGHVRIYEWNGDAWIQRGSDIDSEANGDYNGYSVSLSSDGSVVAMGAIYNDGPFDSNDNRGHVRIYAWNGTIWVQRGADIDGENTFNFSGMSVSLSSNGTIVAIGAPYNDGTSGNTDDNRGNVRIFVWNGTAWVQRGQNINGEAAGDLLGTSVSLSADGSIVAIGANQNDENGANAGHVRVYEWNGAAWVQRGADIDGEAAGDFSGRSVSISSDGSIVAIGATQNDGNGSNSGHVRVYTWNGSAWIKRGSDIDGEAANDESGYSVSLSANGSIVAIGAYLNDGTTGNAINNRGHVRVYAWE